jgi:hypothetical protein
VQGNKKRSIIAAFAFCLLPVSSAVLAHHGANLYDTTKPLVLKGTVTKFTWGNPHNQIFFDVKDDQGNVAEWVAATEPPLVMMERGWTRRSLKIGEEVTIYIFAAKNGATVGNLQKVVLPDGTELTAR